MPQDNNKNTDELQQRIRAVPMKLFPVQDSLESVIKLGCSQLPITNQNTLVSLFMTYHNTLLKEIECPQSNQ